jgi:hypothetical protein
VKRLQSVKLLKLHVRMHEKDPCRAEEAVIFELLLNLHVRMHDKEDPCRVEEAVILMLMLKLHVRMHERAICRVEEAVIFELPLNLHTSGCMKRTFSGWNQPFCFVSTPKRSACESRIWAYSYNHFLQLPNTDSYPSLLKMNKVLTHSAHLGMLRPYFLHQIQMQRGRKLLRVNFSSLSLLRVRRLFPLVIHLFRGGEGVCEDYATSRTARFVAILYS